MQFDSKKTEKCVKRKARRAKSSITWPYRRESTEDTDESMTGRKDVVLGFFYTNNSGSRLKGSWRCCAAEAVQTKCLLSTPVSSSVLLGFFPPPNTTALLFSSADCGKIRCHHLNIKVPSWKSAYSITFGRTLPVEWPHAKDLGLLTSVIFTNTGLSVDMFLISPRCHFNIYNKGFDLKSRINTYKPKNLQIKSNPEAQ